MKNYKLKPMLLAMMLLGISPSIFAEAENTETLPEVSVKASKNSANKATGFVVEQNSVGVLGDVAIEDTPYSITVINQQLLKNTNIRDLKDISRLDASVTQSFSNEGYYDALSIRGFNLNNWTNYYKNGLLFANQAKTAFENIERIEIQHGLTGMLQGFAAPGGAVNYVTKRPTAVWQKSLYTYLDENGTLIPHLDVGGPLTEDGRIGVRVNLAGGNQFSFVDEVKTSRKFGSIAVDIKPIQDVIIKLDAELDKRDSSNPQPSILATTDNTLLRNINPERYFGQKWQSYQTLTKQFGMSAEWAFSQDWSVEFKANTAYLMRDDFASNVGDFSSNGDFEVFEYQSPNEVRRSNNVQLAFRGQVDTFDIEHTLNVGYAQRNLAAIFSDGVYNFAGLSNVYNPVQIANPNTPNLTEVYTAIRNKDRGIFVSDLIEFNPQLQALLGFRTSKVLFKSVFSDQDYDKTITTPTYALIYKPIPNVSIYGSYIEGLQQGATAPNTATNFRQQLNPVVSEQKEIGIKADFAQGAIKTSAAMFEIEVPSAFVDPATNVFGYNGMQRHRGLELAAAGALWSGGRLSASALFMNPKTVKSDLAATEGQIPTGVSKRQASLWLDQTTPIDGLSAQLGLRYSSERAVNSDGRLFVPSWVVYDAGIRYATQINQHNINIGLQVLNLTDKAYFASADFGFLDFGQSRTVKASAQIDF